MPRHGRAFVTGVLLSGLVRQVVALTWWVVLGECAGQPGRGTVHQRAKGWPCSAMRLRTWGARLVARNQVGRTHQGSRQASSLRRGVLLVFGSYRFKSSHHSRSTGYPCNKLRWGL